MVKFFWVPKTKKDLVECLAVAWPGDRTKFLKMKKKQLYAILFRLRRSL